ncbi:unnamed protein product [Camellia sinensis]
MLRHSDVQKVAATSAEASKLGEEHLILSPSLFLSLRIHRIQERIKKVLKRINTCTKIDNKDRKMMHYSKTATNSKPSMLRQVHLVLFEQEESSSSPSMENILNTTKSSMDGDPRRTERNANVVIHDERDFNVIRIGEAHNNNVISKGALAQRAQRERERNEKASSAYQFGQRLRCERERSRELISPSTTNTPPAQEGAVLTHLTSPSTSLASQRNWPTHASPFLHETRNIGVVTRNKCNLNIIRIAK